PLDAAWVRRQFAVNGLLAGDASVDRVLALVQLLNRSFLTAGFVNSGLIVPPQPDVAGGVLELRLVYGRLVPATPGGPAVAVAWRDGKRRGLTEAFVRHRMPSTRDRPLSAIAIERDFRLLAEDAAIRTVNADLRPGVRPGEASLLLSIIPQDPVDLYVSFANSRSPSVGGERGAVGGSARNLLSAGDLITGEYGMTDGLKDATLAYSTPFLDPATYLSLRGSLNDASVIDEPLLPLDIRSRDRAAEIGLSRRLVNTPLTPSADSGWKAARTFTIGASVGYRRSKSFLFGEPFSFSPGSVDGRASYHVARLNADYISRSVDQVFAGSLTLNAGLDGTRSNVAGVPNPKRHFVSVLAQVNFARRLSRRGLELRSRLTGQIADSVLYAGERLSTGGDGSVRGYRENLLLTDEGAIGSIELSRPFSLSRGRRRADGIDWGAFAVTAFVDGAYVNNVRSVDPARKWLVSIGPALTWQPTDAIVARASYGVALRAVRQTGSRDIQDDGIHVRVTVYPLRLLGI
ncbi:MAG: ShlB/FhaC/HecB family hemolysin secretion/activation protein, partial [Sphingomonas sp.]